MNGMGVYKSISAVQAELAAVGISKDRKNEQQGYKFRGIDDVYNELAPFLAKHGLCILPRCLSRDVVEKVNAKGTTLFFVAVAMEFDFICVEDGSKHTVGPMYGEAMDSGDKASNKAMSAAYKYACMQSFCIPTEGDNDADATTHDVSSSFQSKAEQAQTPPELSAVQKGLLKALGAACKGDEGEMSLLLAELTKVQKDGEWKYLKLEQVRNPQYHTESWQKVFADALNKLRKQSHTATVNPWVKKIDALLTSMCGDSEAAKSELVNGILGKPEWRTLDEPNLQSLAFILENRKAAN